MDRIRLSLLAPFVTMVEYESVDCSNGWQGYRGRPLNGISSDFAALISPMMYREFFLPGIMEERRFLDRSTYHLNGPGRSAIWTPSSRHFLRADWRRPLAA